MKNVEAAKKLLLKAMEIGDEELITMANELLEMDKDKTEEKATATKEKTRLRPTTMNQAEDSEFIFTRSKSVESSSRSTPVNEVKNRINTFTDDGTEAKDVETPQVDLTERKRKPFKMIKQTCKKCNETFETHPTHKREFYVCDRCIK